MSTVHEPDFVLALGYAPARFRPFLAAVFAFDTQLSKLAYAPREPIFTQMRLAWWREEVGRIGAGCSATADPLLRQIAEFPQEQAIWAAIVDGWDGYCSGDHAAFANGRGGALFAFAAGDMAWQGIGEGWALAMIDPETALAKLKPLRTLRASRDILPLAILAWFTLRDLETPPEMRTAPGSPRRMLRALRYALAGPH